MTELALFLVWLALVALLVLAYWGLPLIGAWRRVRAERRAAQRETPETIRSVGKGW